VFSVLKLLAVEVREMLPHWLEKSGNFVLKDL